METKLNTATIPEGSILTSQIENVLNGSGGLTNIGLAFQNINDAVLIKIELNEDAEGVITGKALTGEGMEPLGIWIINKALAISKNINCVFTDKNGILHYTSNCTISMQPQYFAESWMFTNMAPTLKAHFDDFIIVSNQYGFTFTLKKIKPEDNVLEMSLIWFLSNYMTIPNYGKVRLHNVWLSKDSSYGLYYRGYSPIVEFSMENSSLAGDDLVIHNVTLKYEGYVLTSNLTTPMTVHVETMRISIGYMPDIYLWDSNGEYRATFQHIENRFTILNVAFPEGNKQVFIKSDQHGSFNLYSNSELNETIDSNYYKIYANIGVWFSGFFEDSFGNRGHLADRLPYNAYDNRGQLLWGCNNQITYGPLSIYGIHKINGSFNIINKPQTVDVTGNYQVIS